MDIPVEVIWGIAARAVACVYMIAFGTILAEVIPLVGSKGITPIGPRLEHVRKYYGAKTAWLRHPTLLWLNSSDAALKGFALLGMVCAALAALGFYSPVMFLAARILYLAFDLPMQLTFPWESMLYETGFLTIFLPSLNPLPSLALSAAPQPLLAFAFHWLLFRLMFGFGKTKFTKDALHEPEYLRSFLISQPLPSPLGWLLSKFPKWVLVGMLGKLFVIEMILPFFVFFPGWPRMLAGIGFAALMFGIQTNGNFGFFNVLVIGLSPCLFDTRMPWHQPLSDLSPLTVLALIAASWNIVAGLIHLPFNTWVARGWLEWPLWGGVKEGTLIFNILHVLRTAMPFRTVHAYGVFPPQVGYPLKFIHVFEGSNDNKKWETFEYKFMTCTEKSKPVFVAPHTPRLDHMAIYEAMFVGSQNNLGTIFASGNPFDVTAVGQLDRILQRILEDDSPVRSMFKNGPFHGKAPKYARAQLYMFAQTSYEDMQRTGNYWRKSLIGAYDFPSRCSEPALLERWLPYPGQLNPDERWARRRVQTLAPLCWNGPASTGSSSGKSAIVTMKELKGMAEPELQELWDVYWNEVIPGLKKVCDECLVSTSYPSSSSSSPSSSSSSRASPDSVRGNWLPVVAYGVELERKYGALNVHRLDAIRGLVATLLLERMEPHLLALREPQFKVSSYFQAAVAGNSVMLGGPEAVHKAQGDVVKVLGEVCASQAAEDLGLMMLIAFRPQTYMLHARKSRLAEVLYPKTPPPPDELPGFGKLMPKLAIVLPDEKDALPNAKEAGKVDFLLWK